MGVVLLSILLLWFIQSRRVPRELAWLKAQGLPVTFEEAGLSTVETVAPEEKNWKRLEKELKPAEAITFPVTGQMQLVGSKTFQAITLWPDLPAAVKSDSGRITWAEWNRFLDPLRETLAKVPFKNEAGMIYKLDYRQGIATPLPHVQICRALVRAHYFSALGHLGTHRVEAALCDIELGRQIKDQLIQPNILIEGLVLISSDLSLLSVSWELLQQPGLTETQLATLARIWESQLSIRQIQRLWEGERVCSWQTLTQFQTSSSSKTWASLGTVNGENWWEMLSKRRPLDWIHRELILPHDLAYYLRASGNFEKRVAGWAKGGSYEEVRQESERQKIFLDEMVDSWRKPGYLLSLLVIGGNLESASNRFSCFIAQQRLLQTAIALERHRLKQGEYPMALTALVPAFLPAVPLDPMDHQPLRYRLSSDGDYVLYSIGVDGKDDGGDGRFVKEQGGGKGWRPEKTADAVWPRVPAEALPKKKEEGRKKNGI
jgi:hypothetical protein